MFENIVKLFNKITQQYPIIEDFRINSFAVVNSVTDVQESNALQLQRDMKNGFFFSRSWSKANNKESERKRDLPCLFIQRDNIIDFGELKTGSQQKQRLKIGVVCTDMHDRYNLEIVKSNMVQMLLSTLQEACNHSVFTIQESQRSYNAWATQKEIDRLIENNTIISATNLNVLAANILRSPSNIAFVDYGMPNLVTCEINVMLLTCNSTNEFDYSSCTPRLWEVNSLNNFQYSNKNYNNSFG